MTNHDDQTDEVFEQMARKAGAALRRPAPSDGIDRLRSARRRQQILRSSMAVGAALIIVVVALSVLKRPADRTVGPVDSPAQSTPTTTPTTTPPSTTTPNSSELSLAYTLTGIDGLAPRDEPQSTHVSSDTSMLAAWSAADGVANGYLVLMESQLPNATAPEGDVTSVSIDVPDGHAFLVTDNGFESLTSATRVMWWRGDGRLWIVSNFNLTPERLTSLTLAIQPGSGLPYVLPDPTMKFIGFNTSNSFRSVIQDWGLDSQILQLGVSTGGLAQQIQGVSVSVIERNIAGKPGYVIKLANGQVNLTWPTDNADQWGSLIINKQLAGRLDDLAGAIAHR